MNPGSKIQLEPWVSVDRTLQNVYALINSHYKDDYLIAFDNSNIKEIFNYVKDLPYVEDPRKDKLSGYDDIEMLKSPYLTNYTGGDCDDKAIYLGSIFKRKNIPFRMAVVSTTPDQNLHHIYPEIFLKGYWVPSDATYNHNELFTESEYTKKRIYDDNSGKLVSYEIDHNNPDTHTANSNNLILQNMNRSKVLNGPPSMMLGGGAALGILQGKNSGGCSTGMCDCTNCSKSGNCSKQDIKNILQSFNEIPIAMLLGRGRSYSGLGFDPVSIAATIANFISSVFGSHYYVDAYHAYEAAARSLPGGGAPAQATIAILLVDYMNPPGADYCTSPDKCGNRADWATIQPEVMSKVQQATPFFSWYLHEIDLGHYAHDMSDPVLRNLWNDCKNHGPLYMAFVAANPPGSSGNPGTVNINPNTGLPIQTGTTIAGMSATSFILLAGAAVGIYYATKKKKARSHA